ncbi:hypothetical protein [Streptomyces sp. NPDC046985]|uniref:hypothetical protein n=1 Tax=Streptomyces sp. NPDC046985 TaxID=3155377 RepID=UPI0033E459C4
MPFARRRTTRRPIRAGSTGSRGAATREASGRRAVVRGGQGVFIVGRAFMVRIRCGPPLGLVRPIMSGCSALRLGDEGQPKVIDAVEVLCLDYDG